MRRYVYVFFQAEDGIRDTSVTGVQTCALPILFDQRARAGRIRPAAPAPARRRSSLRSEERRVGKECRARGLPEQVKQNYVATYRGVGGKGMRDQAGRDLTAMTQKGTDADDCVN